jgi:hypothetical protein
MMTKGSEQVELNQSTPKKQKMLTLGFAALANSNNSLFGGLSMEIIVFLSLKLLEISFLDFG